MQMIFSEYVYGCKALFFYFSISVIIPQSHSCKSLVPEFLSRSFGSGSTQRSSSGAPRREYTKSVTRINSPGQRFTATHGISAKVKFI